mgnify:CR=1 FL=1
MGFLSLKFLIFLPIVLVLYFAARKRGRDDLAKAVLIAASVIFFIPYGAGAFFMLLASSVVNFFLSKLLEKRKEKALLATSIIINVLPLLYFKYFNFFAENAFRIAGREYEPLTILQPVAISYYTFQMITWCVDTYRGETKETGALDYFAYVWFFPRVVLGPITRHDEFIPQLNDKDKALPNAENIAKGFIWFTIGMAKKLLLAARFAGAMPYGLSLGGDMSLMDGWLCSVAYTFEIYLDFSGYCDMAAGVSKMFNLSIPMNFNSPYKALSISDFWKRWHISLTSFLRKYIYFPLGGNRKGVLRTYLNMMAIFVISGFWHGANWTFILWGALHGFVMIIERLLGKRLEKIPKIIRLFVTFALVNFGWILFASPDISSAWIFIKQMFDFGNIMPSIAFYDTFKFGTTPFIRYHLNLFIPLLYVVTFICLQCTKNVYEKEYRPNIRMALCIGVLFVWAFLYSNNVSQFIYSQF